MSTLGYFVRRLTTFKDRTFISKTWKRYLSEELGPKYYAEESSVTLTETPSELADRYLQSLLRRATAGNEDKTSKAPLWELPGDVVRPAPSSTHSSNSLDSDQQIVQQVRALFHDHKDVGLGSARPKFREMFTHRVAGEVAKQIRRLLLEPRFRLIETLATDLSPNVADMEKSVEYLKVQREQSPTTPETGENWKDSTGEDSLEANEEIEQPIEDVPASDRFLAVREQLTPPFYRVFKAMLDHPEGVMAVLQLRTVMGYRKELMDPFRVAVHRHLKYLSNRLVLDLFREDMLVLESSNIDSNARTIMFSYNDWRQEWNPRRTIFELLERLNKGCKVFNLKHKSQPLLTMATAHVAFCEQLPASDEEVGKLCEPYRSDRALHPVINHIRVRSLLGGLDMEQKVINHILYKDLPLRMNYNGDVYTLSVVRRFVSWLFHQMKLFNGSAAPSFQDRMVLSADDAAVVNTILEVLKDNTTDTAQVLDPAAVEDQLIRAKDTIMKLCAYYILRADGYVIRCSDPVARIHFSNGAELYRINYMADVSRSRLRESLGITVNFRYRLQDQERNILRFYKGEPAPACSELGQWIPVVDSMIYVLERDMQVGSPKGAFQSYLNEKGELAQAFPTRLHSSLEVFDWLFCDKPEEGFQVERFEKQLLCISGYSYSNGSHKEKVSQNYLVKCYKDGFLFLYCLNDLSWSHYAIPIPLQKYAPNISRSVFDVYTGERFDFHILSNGMVLTVLAQYATSCVTLHNAVLWHPMQPGFPPSRRIYAVEVVKMSNCYLCQQSSSKCQCVQNQRRLNLSSSRTTQVRINSSEREWTSSGSKSSTRTPLDNGKRASSSEYSHSSSVTDLNTGSSSSANLNYVVDPNTIKTLFGPWKGTKRVIVYNPNTGQIQREQRSFFRLQLDWAAALEVRQVQTKVVTGLFNNLFNPTSDLLLSFPEQEKQLNSQCIDFTEAASIVDDCI